MQYVEWNREKHILNTGNLKQKSGKSVLFILKYLIQLVSSLYI